MQYVLYFAVATPLVFVWLLWAAAVTPPQPPRYDTGLNAIANQAVVVDDGNAAPAGSPKAVAANDKENAGPSADLAVNTKG